MPIAIGLIGLAVGAAGTAVQVSAARKQASAQKKAAVQQAFYEKQAEDARKKAMELDSNRRKREQVRQQQAARSQALAVATAQGAGDAGSSVLGGAYGGISGATGRNIQEVEQNTEIGRDIFAANEGASNARAQGAIKSANAGSLSALGGGITSLGGAIANNAGTIAKIGGYS